jgi:hypothetical protein
MKAFSGGLKIAPDRATVRLVPLHRCSSSGGEYLGRARRFNFFLLPTFFNQPANFTLFDHDSPADSNAPQLSRFNVVPKCPVRSSYKPRCIFDLQERFHSAVPRTDDIGGDCSC